jgi:hypothetical protein
MLPPLELSFEEQSGIPDPSLLVVAIKGGGLSRSVIFKSSGPGLRKSGDVLLCLGLIPAMELGCDLVIGMPVDTSLLENAEKIRAMLCDWYPGYRPVNIHAERTTTQYPPSRGSGVFFSAGVDSSFSLVDARSRLDGLVTLIGADVALSDSCEADHLKSVARNVGAAYGLEAIIIETDVRTVFDRMIGWVEYHGAVLGAVRHMLADRFENQLIASSADESSWTRRWGSHPALDPLFGTDGARMEHHGLVHRLAKIQRILSEPMLMNNLRVCDYQHDNCGVCEDCTFMVQALDTLGGLDRAPTFPTGALAGGRIRVTGEGSKSDLLQLEAAAFATGRSRRLVDDIDRAMRSYETKKKINAVLQLPELKRRFKRLKRRYRYWRAAHRD